MRYESPRASLAASLFLRWRRMRGASKITSSEQDFDSSTKTKTKTTTTNATTITTAKTTTTGRLELQRLHRVKKDFVLTADQHKNKDDNYKCNDSNNHNRTHGASFGLTVSDNKNNKIIITTIKHMVRQRLHRVKKIPD